MELNLNDCINNVKEHFEKQMDLVTQVLVSRHLAPVLVQLTDNLKQQQQDLSAKIGALEQSRDRVEKERAVRLAVLDQQIEKLALDEDMVGVEKLIVQKGREDMSRIHARNEFKKAHKTIHEEHALLSKQREVTSDHLSQWRVLETVLVECTSAAVTTFHAHLEERVGKKAPPDPETHGAAAALTLMSSASVSLDDSELDSITSRLKRPRDEPQPPRVVEKRARVDLTKCREPDCERDCVQGKKRCLLHALKLAVAPVLPTFDDMDFMDPDAAPATVTTTSITNNDVYTVERETALRERTHAFFKSHPTVPKIDLINSVKMYHKTFGRWSARGTVQQRKRDERCVKIAAWLDEQETLPVDASEEVSQTSAHDDNGEEEEDEANYNPDFRANVPELVLPPPEHSVDGGELSLSNDESSPEIARVVNQCEYCRKRFSKPSDKKLHVERVHMPSFHACSHAGCKSWFKTRHDLKRHVGKRHEVGTYQCPYPECQQKFLERGHLGAHMSLKHAKK